MAPQPVGYQLRYHWAICRISSLWTRAIVCGRAKPRIREDGDPARAKGDGCANESPKEPRGGGVGQLRNVLGALGCKEKGLPGRFQEALDET